MKLRMLGIRMSKTHMQITDGVRSMTICDRGEMSKIPRAANAAQLRSKRNSRPRHRVRAASRPVVARPCHGPADHASRDQAKELRTMQILSAKPLFEHTARMRPQAQDEVSAATVMKSHVAQMLEASAEPHAKIFGDESLLLITSVDLKEVQRLARFLPVIVLVHRSTGAHQVAPHKVSLAKSSSERSETTDLLGVLGKAVERFKSPSGGRTVAFWDVTINFSAIEALPKGEPLFPAS